MSTSRLPRGGVPLLVAVLRDPHHASSLSPGEWDVLLSTAEQSKLAGRIADIVGRAGAETGAPRWARDRLDSACIHGKELERVVRWEIDRVLRALRPADVQPVFLKGAGYVASGLPFAFGRVVADVDILVPESALPQAEAALQRHGWAFVEQTAYDERYYRQWMHELPPMRHTRRGTILDVHHAILPRTGRLKSDSGRLLQRSVSAGGARVLCPTHMVLHAAVHLLYDGAPTIRELADLDSLLRHFATAEADFWPRLLADARELGLERPAFYALRYAQHMFGTPVPPDLWAGVHRAAPAGPTTHLMDALVDATLQGQGGGAAALGSLALYVRAHWLRMPPRLLFRHLAHQGVARR